jgi:surface antigen
MTRIQRPTATRHEPLQRFLRAVALAVALPCLVLAGIVQPGVATAEPAAASRQPRAEVGSDVASVPAASRAAAPRAQKPQASAAQHGNRATQKKQATRPASAQRQAAHAPQRRIQCVQYVVANSAFRVRGNARDWWRNSAGVHARGSVPEPGSVLSFRSVRSMPLGHVALVSRVVSDREIIIDHANWTRGAITRGASVIDVSPRNDWTAVRVTQKAGSGVYGKVYPTDGFIHPRAHDDVVNVAERPADAGLPAVVPVPRSGRPAFSGRDPG